MDRISRKLTGNSAPAGEREIFPGSSNSFPTHILAVDERVPAPRRLIELSLDAVRTAMNEIDLKDIDQRNTVADYFTIWPGEHYKLLGALVKVMRPKVVIEIGTDTGLSALTIKKYLPADGRVVTFDLRPWRSVEGTDFREDDFADGRLEQRLVDLADPAAFAANKDLLASAEFFFIDGPKNISFEVAFMEHLKTIRFPKPPILMFDDTRLTSMLKFWRDLPYPKLDLTGFGHWSGTGLVEFTA